MDTILVHRNLGAKGVPGTTAKSFSYLTEKIVAEFLQVL